MLNWEMEFKKWCVAAAAAAAAAATAATAGFEVP
jgi:hypothetical protein